MRVILHLFPLCTVNDNQLCGIDSVSHAFEKIIEYGFKCERRNFILEIKIAEELHISILSMC